VSSTGPQVEVTLYSVFASKKKGTNVEEKQGPQASSITPGNFQVSAKLDEESRKDSLLTLSFVISLNDSRGLVTYEFRGSCSIIGSSAEFSMLMEADRNKVPLILDAIYQRLYPVMFLMAGVTVAPYPQSTALASDMIAASQPMTTTPAATPQQVQSKEKEKEPATSAESAAKTEVPEQITATRNTRNSNKATQSVKDDGMQELVETISGKMNQNQKPKESLEKASESESLPVTKKSQQVAKGKVSLT
jgi:hypothetical protein